MIGGFGVALGTHGAGLLVRIANRFNRGLRSERLIEVHGAAAGNQKDMLHPLIGDKTDYVVGKLHGSNRKRDLGKVMECRSLHSLVNTSCVVRPRAASSASINSRTAPLPPGALEIKFARAKTSDAAFAGAADNPAIAIAGRSLTSSPMKQTSVSFTPAAAANSRSAAALSRHPLTT